MSRRIRRTQREAFLPQGFRDPAQHLYARHGCVTRQEHLQHKLMLTGPEVALHHHRAQQRQVLVCEFEEHGKTCVAESA
jgi:hypothetical protein